MCRTDKSTPCQWAVLCILLIGCLSAHFLLEDLRLLPGPGMPEQSAPSTDHPAADEIEHQDDLINLAAQPVRIAESCVPPVSTLSAPVEMQACNPIFPPPKIA